MPYYRCTGIARFKQWNLVPEPPMPIGDREAPTNHRKYRTLLHKYCGAEPGRDLEFFNQRQLIFREVVARRVNPPAWMTLDLGEYEDHRHWSEFLQDLGIDDAAQTFIKDLADDRNGWGPWEVNRILAHLFKGTASAIQGAGPLPRKSGWVAHSCNEAM